MNIKLQWVCINPNHSPDEGGYYRSSEGRFEISPNFRHTVYPDSYTLTDSARQDKARIRFDTIRDAKAHALACATREMEAVIANLN